MNILVKNMTKEEQQNLNTDFNYKFYVETYPDVTETGFDNYEKALSHWNNYGKFEGRVCNSEMMITKIKSTFYENLKKINQYKNLPHTNFPFINILVRTHNREKLFNICLESIYEQGVDSRILVSCDNDDNLNYILEYPDLEINFLSLSSTNKYKFNLYCNYLLSNVKEGWIFFLDDDDMFLHPNSIRIILQHIEDEHDLIIWKFLRSDKEIYPIDLNNIKKGEICSCNFCFHSKFRKISKWPSKQFGDFFFFENLINKFDFNIKFIPITLTGNIENTKIGNFGGSLNFKKEINN